MAKGLGIAALVVAIIGIFVPVVTIYVIWLSLILAAIAGLLGDKVFPIASFFANLVNIVFLSPMTWAVLAGENVGGGSFFAISTFILFIAPIVTLVIGSIRNKKVLSLVE
ncbi:MAG: hypothetical protein KKI12_06225 [Proteobacteria bacterium]|nr:hypothetical protein [Pseudomonadota bacterium]MBU4259835.1 hypothetical protein [Pseudomonadota bacterium]MBU4287753.1 hypothetical protein [Pseudomonadota bacterium]MBU4414335.1 hypothetical protein [Pseudomonadota bacterium]MCG2756835.1 hypothetical protein [Desulfobacteraceae bacterium]